MFFDEEKYPWHSCQATIHNQSIIYMDHPSRDCIERCQNLAGILSEKSIQHMSQHKTVPHFRGRVARLDDDSQLWFYWIYSHDCDTEPGKFQKEITEPCLFVIGSGEQYDQIWESLINSYRKKTIRKSA